MLQKYLKVTSVTSDIARPLARHISHVDLTSSPASKYFSFASPELETFCSECSKPMQNPTSCANQQNWLGDTYLTQDCNSSTPIIGWNYKSREIYPKEKICCISLSNNCSMNVIDSP